MESPKAIYLHRFSPADQAAMQKVWRVLVGQFFQKYIRPSGAVLDLGGGYCGFINHVKAARRIVVDQNPDVRQHADPGVEVIVSGDLSLSQVRDDELDCVFISNFLEHLPDSRAVLRLLDTLRRKLRDNGALLILQPNFRYTGAAYFDFIDHSLVLTDKSLVEALEIGGFRIDLVIRRFLPYTSKSALPKTPVLVSLYLKMPFLWRLFGQQTFIVATKTDDRVGR